MGKRGSSKTALNEESILSLAREKWISGYYNKAEKILLKVLKKTKSESTRIWAYIELGHMTVEAGKLPAALQHYQTALNLAEQGNFDLQKAWALIGLSSAIGGSREPENALSHAINALSLFSTIPDADIGRIEANRQRAFHYLFAGEYQKSQEILEEVIKSLQSLKGLDILGKVFLARAWNVLGAIRVYSGDLEACLVACEKSYQVASETTKQGYRGGMALAANSMGEAYRKLGEYAKALTYYETAFKLDQELGAERDMATALHNMALVYSIRGDYQQASEYFQRSLAIAERHGSIVDQAVFLGDQAGHEHLRGDFKTAKHLFEKSIQLYQNSGSEEELVEKLCWFSGTLVELGELERAENLIHRAKSYARKHKSRSESALCLYHLGVLENIRENFGLAQNFFSDSLKEAEALGARRLAIDSSINLAELAMRRYRLTLSPAAFSTAMDLVKRAEALAEKERLIGSMVNTKIIISALLLAHLDFNGALEALDNAIKLSEEHGFTPHLQRALALKTTIESRQTSAESTISESEEMRELATEDAQRYMRIATQRSRTPAMPDFDANQLFITVIAFGIRGPDVLLSQPIPFEASSQEAEELFLKMGVFYSAAVAQGGLHHQGLYGPLPLSTPVPYSSLIYAITLPDKTQLDNRMKGESYTLFCLNYPNAFEPYFVDRDGLGTIFGKSVALLEDLSLVTLNTLADIRKSIEELASRTWTAINGNNLTATSN
ncbi:MAG: tetratricopeptide repeat protein [Candidatus Thorarchaeota archaeon]